MSRFAAGAEDGPLTLYFVAGELSGDTHAALVMEQIAAAGRAARLLGVGGPRMAQVARETGGAVADWTREAAVLGLWEVLRKYGWFRRQFDTTLAEILTLGPDGVVLVDYPGFNLRLARALRKAGYRGKIIYYISPQVWAWNPGRIPEMAKILDLMICILPFEPPLYERSGLKAVFAGHPLLDHLWEKRIETGREENLVGLFPGSRLREVRKHFPVMIQAARRARRVMPELVFEAAAADERLAEEMRRMLKGDPLVTVTAGSAHELMQRAAAGLVASGTATLEAAYFGMPFGLIYKVAWPTYLAARLVVRLKWIGMVNILAGRTVVNEYIQGRASDQNLMFEILHLMSNDGARLKLQENLAEAVSKLGRGGAAARAAWEILKELERSRSGRQMASAGA